MAAELLPLSDGQHQVVLVPKATTDLPFFYLTKQNLRLREDINYEGTDIKGRPIRWQVFPNNNPAIGAPGIDAHEAWMRLVKPTFDWHRESGKTLDILPLGKLREALRTVGWGEGGWEARRLLRALHQIGAASCVADLWIPTTQRDEQGNQTFQHINATFSKMTIYAIGSKHVTDEELKDGEFNFEFDLEDTLYIQLNPIEVQIQKDQPQRFIDNQYLFSVKPTARRWYELVAPKIFGVVKNKGEYCEVRYSWYIQHHHTLKRYYERYRVVFQMNRLVQDHLRQGYITRIEYRPLKEPGQEIDWIIRYYPGEAAKESIGRILSYRYRQRPGEKERITVRTSDSSGEKERISTRTPRARVKKQPALGHDEVDERLVAELTNRGILQSEAVRIVDSLDLRPEEHLSDILDWGDHLIRQAGPGKIYNPSGFYIHLVKQRAFPPASFETSRKHRLRQEAQQVMAQTVQDEAKIKLAYDDYITAQIDVYVAQNPEQFQEILEAKRQHLKDHKALGLWDDEIITRMSVPAARSETLKNIGAATFASFTAQYRANELAMRVTRLQLPPPAAQTGPAHLLSEQGSELPATAGDDYFVV
jgi:hypothetical protein